MGHIAVHDLERYRLGLVMDEGELAKIGEHLLACPECAECTQKAPTQTEHIGDHDLERYHLGMVVDEGELAAIEEHFLACPECAGRAEEAARCVDEMRVRLVLGDFA